MRITCQTVDRQQYVLDECSPTDTTHSLRVKLHPLTGQLPDNIRLICAGRGLEHEKTLAHYGITEQSIVYVVFRRTTDSTTPAIAAKQT